MPTGLLNSILEVFGIPNQSWLRKQPDGDGRSLIIMAVFAGLGQKYYYLYGCPLLGVDATHYEAAEVDGAGFFQKIRYIVWPMGKTDDDRSWRSQVLLMASSLSECIPDDRRRPLTMRQQWRDC